MAKYSRVYKVGKRRFRYDYDICELQYLGSKKDLAEAMADNDELGRPLWDIADGELVIDSIGLSPDSWREDPRYWCERYSYDLDEELAYLMRD